MKTKQQILEGLGNFYGTQAYHRFSALFRNVVLTDGMKYLCDSCESYWLADICGSILADKKIAAYCKRYSPAVARIVKTDKGGAVFTLGDEKKPVYRQEIPFTDFPLPSYEFYIGDNGDFWVLFLTSEN